MTATETRTALREAAQFAAAACDCRVGNIDIVWAVDEDAEANGTEPEEWCVKIPVKLYPRRKSDTRWTTVRGHGVSPMAAALMAVERFQEHVNPKRA
jgi:hypothetical protein